MSGVVLVLSKSSFIDAATSPRWYRRWAAATFAHTTSTIAHSVSGPWHCASFPNSSSPVDTARNVVGVCGQLAPHPKGLLRPGNAPNHDHGPQTLHGYICGTFLVHSSLRVLLDTHDTWQAHGKGSGNVTTPVRRDAGRSPREHHVGSPPTAKREARRERPREQAPQVRHSQPAGAVPYAAAAQATRDRLTMPPPPARLTNASIHTQQSTGREADPFARHPLTGALPTLPTIGVPLDRTMGLTLPILDHG